MLKITVHCQENAKISIDLIILQWQKSQPVDETKTSNGFSDNFTQVSITAELNEQ